MRVQQEHDLLMQREQQQQQQQQQRFNQQVFQQQQINQQPFMGIGAPPVGIPHQLPQIHGMNLPPPTQPMMNQQKKGLSLNVCLILLDAVLITREPVILIDVMYWSL